MITIRSGQIDSLEAAQRVRFHRKLLSLYRKEIANEVACFDDSALLDQIAEAHEKARGYGIESERGVSRFVGLRLITKPPFDEHPLVREYLERNDIEVTKKMDLIFESVVNHFEQSGRVSSI